LATCLLVTGCAASGRHPLPTPPPAAEALPAAVAARADFVARDPRGYLFSVAENCRKLEQYTLTFIREERRGFLNLLQGPEKIRCWFRRDPFSVRMLWLDPNVKYGESTYVAGEADNKVRFVPRHGFLGLPPKVVAVDLQTPVIWGESRRPLTDFGLERLMERTLVPLRESGEDARVTYVGVELLPETGRFVHHIRLEYPIGRYAHPTQELYVDAENDLPAGTLLLLASGSLDAAYFYYDINPAVTLTDADFLMEAERRSTASAP